MDLDQVFAERLKIGLILNSLMIGRDASLSLLSTGQRCTEKQKKAPVKANKEANKALKVQSAEVNASLNDLQTQIIGLIRLTSNISYNELSAATGKDRSTIMRNISKLKKAGLLRRVGSKKTGYWEVL